MADTFVVRPRRAKALIELHGGEITAVVLTDDILHSFTEEELKKMHTALGYELQERELKDQPQLERNNAPDPS